MVEAMVSHLIFPFFVSEQRDILYRQPQILDIQPNRAESNFLWIQLKVHIMVYLST